MRHFETKRQAKEFIEKVIIQHLKFLRRKKDIKTELKNLL